ncbi:MAG TPA: hypothetical protein DEP72_08390 [Clostridiales bacterium]|nr:hypothetical protein [Clostridiales bacterium]
MRMRKNKKRGFTLLELLAVLVILAALATIAIPIFINKGDTAKQVADNENMRTLQQQAQGYLLTVDTPIDATNIIPEMVVAGFIKEAPTYPIDITHTYAVEVTGGIAKVKLNGPVAPTLVITSSPISPTSATSITYTFTFSAPVTGFDINDVGVSVGTKGAFGGSGAEYTLEVTNSDLGSTQIITVAAGAATSTLGVASLAGNTSVVLEKTANDIIIGDYVKFGTYNATPIVWRVINKVDQAYLDANTGSGLHVGDLMLFANTPICNKAFDAKETAVYSIDPDRQSYGSNNWSNSNLKEWLNSTQATTTYTTNPPTGSNVTANPYEAAGFLSSTNFSAQAEGKIVPVTHKSMLASLDTGDGNQATDHTYNATISTVVQNFDTARYKNTINKVFPLSTKELYDNVYNNSSLSDRTTYYYNAGWYYWLRDSYVSNWHYVRHVDNGGPVNVDFAYNGSNGVRPALFLSPLGMTLDGASGASAGEAMTVTWQ